MDNKTKKYKEIIDSITGGVIDQSLSMVPGVNMLWGGIKNAIEGSKNMRILRGIEFFENIYEKDFFSELEKSEQALDGLALCFEANTKERNKTKRNIIKNIFLGFTKLSEKEKEKFELERLLDITNKISIEEVDLLIEANKKGIKMDGVEQIPVNSFIDNMIYKDYDNIHNIFSIQASNESKHSSGKPIIDIIYGLIGLGLLALKQKKEIKNYFNLKNNIYKDEIDYKKNQFYEITYLGKQFIKYINN